MIKTFRHKGPKRLYERDDTRGLRADLVLKARTILAHLDEAQTIEDVRLPGFRLHRLKGDRKGLWAVNVSGNWRIVFRFERGKVFDVELVDYH